MPETWKTLLGGVATARRRLKPGEVLVRAADPARALYHVERGRLVVIAADGMVLQRPEAGTLFGETALFTECVGFDAMAETAAEIIEIPRRAALLHLQAHPDLNLAFTAYLARCLQAARARVELLRLKSARDRVLAFLIQSGAGKGPVTLPRPLTAIAMDIGLTHEALYRTLRALQREGRITRSGKRTFALNSAG